VGRVATDARRAMADERAERRVARLARLGTWLVRILGRTWRIRAMHDAGWRELRASRQPAVLSLWHGHLLTHLYHHRGQGITVLVSEHGDGEIIARIAERMGYHTVRGSTSRGAARALLEASRVIERGGDVAFTPDGPRGPARSVAPGVAVVAHRTGAPVIGGFARARSTWRLSTWDRFEIPKPFTRITIGYSDPVYVEAAESRDAADSSHRIAELMATAESRANG
jgi:lysophospholipid acyltransferase (LPLAT)-like uncharacterized protein